MLIIITNDLKVSRRRALTRYTEIIEGRGRARRERSVGTDTRRARRVARASG